MPEGFHIGQKEEISLHEQSNQQVAKNLSFLERIDAFLVESQKIKNKDIVVFFRLLATMLNAGVSLVKSLKVLQQQTTNRKLQKVLGKITLNIENGQGLSDSLREFPNIFNGAQIGMLASGEATGKLNQILLQLATQTEKSAGLKSKIRNAMMYPALIISFVFLAGLVMMYMVVPQLTSVFKDAGVELPTTTKILVNISDFLQAKFLGIPNVVNVLLFVVIALVFFVKWKKSPSGKKIWDRIILKMPLFGNLTKKAILAQFCQSLSSLTSSGISIVKSLKIVSEIVDNEVYRARILMISEDVKHGISIGENLKDDTDLFPVMVASMIAVGEQTAQLDTVTEKIAAFYQDEVDDMVKNLSSLLEPFIIVIIGAGVGFLVAALMKPIMMMSEVATQS